MGAGELKLPKKFLVPPPKIDFPTGEFLAANGVSLYASAESQKIGHVRIPDSQVAQKPEVKQEPSWYRRSFTVLTLDSGRHCLLLLTKGSTL